MRDIIKDTRNNMLIHKEDCTGAYLSYDVDHMPPTICEVFPLIKKGAIVLSHINPLFFLISKLLFKSKPDFIFIFIILLGGGYPITFICPFAVKAKLSLWCEPRGSSYKTETSQFREEKINIYFLTFKENA